MKRILLIIDILLLLLFISSISYSMSVSNNKRNLALEAINSLEEDDVSISFENSGSTAVLLSNNMKGVVTLNSWTWPTDSDYIITSYYGYRGSSLHEAIDIYSYQGYGAPAYSDNGGTVVATQSNCIAGNTSCNSGMGNYIVIRHGDTGYYTIYMHLSSILVSVNQDVASGDIIGKIGNTGNVYPVPTSANPYAGAHLHYGVFIGNPLAGGYSINPLTLY